VSRGVALPAGVRAGHSNSRLGDAGGGAAAKESGAHKVDQERCRHMADGINSCERTFSLLSVGAHARAAVHATSGGMLSSCLSRSLTRLEGFLEPRGAKWVENGRYKKWALY
jgi:hypothetical protein